MYCARCNGCDILRLVYICLNLNTVLALHRCFSPRMMKIILIFLVINSLLSFKKTFNLIKLEFDEIKINTSAVHKVTLN